MSEACSLELLMGSLTKKSCEHSDNGGVQGLKLSTRQLTPFIS